jgi:hypothetical protein
MGPSDPRIEGSKELYGVQTCRRPRPRLASGYVIYDSISKTRGLRAASGHRLVLFCHFGEPAVTFGTISSVIIDNIELLLLLLIHATLYTLSNFNLNTSNIPANKNDEYWHIKHACIIKYQYVWNTHFEYTVVEMQNNFVWCSQMFLATSTAQAVGCTRCSKCTVRRSNMCTYMSGRLS